METIAKLTSKTLATLTAMPEPLPITKASAKLHDWNYEIENSPDCMAALSAATQFCDDMAANKKPYWLSLLGKSGTGKTHLATRIMQFFARHVRGTQYIQRFNHVSCRDCCYRKWQSVMSQIYARNYGIVESLSDEWLVTIDDVGAEHDPRKFGVSKLLEILDAREGKWTVITSNLMLPEIAEHLDTRLASRLIRNGSKVVQMTCKDFNLRK